LFAADDGAVLGHRWTAVALSLLVTQAAGERTRLLHVGSTNPLLTQIERDLGHVVTTDRVGHDGQFNYLIARDPFGRGTTPAALSTFDSNGPRYRYRRILLPLIAGGVGQFSGACTLTALIALTALGIGLATVATADLAFQWNVKSGAAFAAMLNGSAFIASGLLTSEPFALGLSLIGVALFLRQRTHIRSGGARGSSAHEREICACAARARRLVVAKSETEVGRDLPRLAHSAGVVERVGSGQVSRKQHRWQRGIAAAILRGGVTRYLLVPWLVLAMCTTLAVWGLANNPARILAILWPLAVLSLCMRAGASPPLSTQKMQASRTHESRIPEPESREGVTSGTDRLESGGR
jgi:hypothetical protein